MNLEIHERARKLIGVARVEGIAVKDREWLDEHLAACSVCSDEAEALASAIRSVALPVSVDPDVVRRTSQLVRKRAHQMQDDRARALPLWIAAATSVALMVVTTPYVWASFVWLSGVTQTQLVVWQLAFCMWWFMPVTVIGMAAAWRQANGRQI